MSQQHSIDCDHCCKQEAMPRGTLGGSRRLPRGWVAEGYREFCSAMCRDDYRNGVSKPSTPRYNDVSVLNRLFGGPE